MELIKIGVDVGNYDTKTQNCTVISGYKKYETTVKERRISPVADIT